MIRALFLYLSQAAWARRLVTRWSIAWHVASRFVAGETLEDALRVTRELNARGMFVTLDHLGEHSDNVEKAKQAAADIVKALDAIERNQLKSGVSLKLSQLGLGLDDALCAENLAFILGHAKEYGIFVRIDMEESNFLDATLNLFRWMRSNYACENLGVVIQAYFYRSRLDIEQLMKEGVRVRLVKGAYREPPDLAFPKKKDVDQNFDRLVEALIHGALDNGAPGSQPDGRQPPIVAVASHDEARVAHAKEVATKAALPNEAIEFQFLYGIRRDLQTRLVAEGYPVRIYVPYGSEWYPYFIRRLAERPANLWFFVVNLFRR